MNRIIKVSRFDDAQAPTGISIRIEIYKDVHAAPVEALTMTPDEAIELHAILGLFQFNNWIASVTGSAAPPIIPAEWQSDPRRGGAS